MSLVRELAERFSLGVIIDLRLLSTILQNNIATFPRSFMIFLMALLASKKRRRHSVWAYQDPVLTERVTASFTFLGCFLRILNPVRIWYGASTMWC